MRIYLASGWFTPKQKEAMDKVRDCLLKEGYSVFAPFYNGIVLSKESSQEERKKVFELDVGMINKCDLMVAIIDGFDPGTMFEMGWAARGNPKKISVGLAERVVMESVPILAYSDVPGRGLNVMLAEACVGFANGLFELCVKLKNINVSEKWLGEIE